MPAKSAAFSRRPAEQPADPALGAVLVALYAAVPACPAELAARFLKLLQATPEAVAGQARLQLHKPYGTNVILEDKGQFGLSFARILPGQSTSYHYHQQRREFFCVHSGVLSLHNGSEIEVLGRLGCGASMPHIAHSLANHGDSMLAVLEIFTPALLDDKVRVYDLYHRPLGEVTLHQ